MIKTIIFDLNEVVVRSGKIDNKVYLEELGIDKKTFWNRLRTFKIGYGLGKVSLEERFLKLLEKLGLNKELLEKAVELYNNDFLVMEGMEEILNKLKTRYNLIMLAGDGKGAITTKVDNFGLRGYFSEIYITYKEGLNKDNPEIYSRVLEKEELNPEGTLFIDDMKSHTKAAESKGIKTILFENVEQMKRELVRFGVKV